jgi:hypothetical protein
MSSDFELAGTPVTTGPGGSPVGGPPIQTVNHLRKAIGRFRHTRPDDRKKLAGHIRDRANDLGARHLPWVDSFLRQQGVGASDASPTAADDNPSTDGPPANSKRFSS